MSRLEYRDGRFWQDGRPLFIVATDYPYFRDRRENWPDRLAKQQASGVNTITFYIPWRHHLRFDEAGRRWYDFDGQTKDSRDLLTYLKLIESLGLYMIIKPGPFIHSELNIGGLPDLVSPSFNPETPPARRHHGGPAVWTYDASQLPAPFDERFDELCREWLHAVRGVIEPYCGPDGPVIALQLNDETIFCMSNDPPWHVGYEPSGIRYYHRLLAARYGDVAGYNRLHGTAYDALDFVPGPRLAMAAAAPSAAAPSAATPPTTAPPTTAPPATGSSPQSPGPQRREDLLSYIDWAEYQWRLRRDLYVRYKEYLGIDLPYLTNYAGITPPIEENVPDLKAEANERVPVDYARLYPEWWFAMNRIESDAADYHYGMISWLGVAAYDRDVFDRYLNTARRARGINMEENWGFGTLYDARSRDPLVPFFQTLVSVAGGATGYVIFVSVNTGYWDDSLDRVTKKQCPTFPSHAPIDEHGNLRPMYHTATMLNRWFREHGEALLECEFDVDCAFLLYAPYAAVSSWVPDQRYWGLADDVPRCGREGFEEFSRSLQSAGYSPAMFELDAASDAMLDRPRALAIHSAFFMGPDEQEKLARYIERGGRLFISGQLPEVDLAWQPATRLKDAVTAAIATGRVVYRRENLFAGGEFARHLVAAGIVPQVATSDERLRAYVFRQDERFFVFFFNFDVAGEHDKEITFYGQRVALRLGSKTSGVLRIDGQRLTGYLVKGVNEVEGIESRIRIAYGDEVVEQSGDFSSVA